MLLLRRWRQSGIVGFDSSSSSTSTGDSTKRGENGRLGEACCRLLAAVVQTTTMHPGTLMADLGAMQGSDSPIVRYIIRACILWMSFGAVVRTLKTRRHAFDKA